MVSFWTRFCVYLSINQKPWDAFNSTTVLYTSNNSLLQGILLLCWKQQSSYNLLAVVLHVQCSLAILCTSTHNLPYYTSEQPLHYQLCILSKYTVNNCHIARNIGGGLNLEDCQFWKQTINLKFANTNCRCGKLCFRIRGIFYAAFTLTMHTNRKIKNLYRFGHMYAFNV